MYSFFTKLGRKYGGLATNPVNTAVKHSLQQVTEGVLDVGVRPNVSKRPINKGTAGTSEVFETFLKPIG